MDREKTIAILFFSRSAGDEICHKRWLGYRSDSNYHLANQLIQKTTVVLENTGFPVYHFNETRQKGRSFGEKIANAYQEVFNLGYDAVVAVGNDCTAISKVNWQDLERALSYGRNVVGPDFRKGAYLIGLTKASFQKEVFQNLPWQTNLLFEALSDYCQNPLILEKQRDINTHFDLMIVSQTNQALKKLIQLLTCIPFQNTVLPTVFTLHFLPAYKSLRAPPFS